MSTKGIRVLIAKVGLDTHDLGARMIANVLKDAGMEVVYLRPHTSSLEVIAAAVQEDVDVIGLSILSGAHLSLCAKVCKLVKKEGLTDKLLIVGGVIPKIDIPDLHEMGVAKVFPTGTHPNNIIEFIKENIRTERN
jgi:methylmalonyl-CoA mutase C-terminal domain/subunit